MKMWCLCHNGLCSLSRRIVVDLLTDVNGACFNKCNGKGVCNKYGRCDCAKGWQGADCSEAVCPFGRAWSGFPTAIDVAHAPAECSNKGICNRESGECSCSEGFTGRACEKQTCKDNCGGKGKCLTIQQYGDQYRNADSAKYVYEPADMWDADKSQGCVCDRGYTNFDCTLRTCPPGDDPLTPFQENEVQLLKCTATEGSFVLYYDNQPSKNIEASFTEEQVRDALVFIPGLRDVSVSFSLGEGATVCQSAANIVSIEFILDFGPQPPLVPLIDDVIAGQSQSVVISADGETTLTDSNQNTLVSIKGTKETEQCAGRGLCSAVEGLCACFTTNQDIYASSDGNGNKGSRGDCGTVTSGQVTTCPGEVQCNGHGVCPTDDTFKCQCETGWAAGDCSERICPMGASWFDYPEKDNMAHQTQTQCSNKGFCDTSTGICECMPGYFGSACEFMSCGGTPELPCNGHGQCFSLTQLAPYTRINGVNPSYTYGADPNNHKTWDGHRIHHCLCDHGYSGYDCSLKTCPMGDDPVTDDQVVERKVMQCIADGGSFGVSFREEKSKDNAIPFTAKEKDVYSTLDLLSTIDDPLVQVVRAFENGTVYHAPDIPVCSMDNHTFIVVDFVKTHGPLPSLGIDRTNLLHGTAPGFVNVFEAGLIAVNNTLKSYKGTTENDVCSNRGLCDDSTGQCVCFPGSYSSNGMGGPGSRNDCGYIEKENKMPELHFNKTIPDKTFSEKLGVPY